MHGEVVVASIAEWVNYITYDMARDLKRNLKLAWHYWETEVADSNWHLQAWKRLLFRVPHYKTGKELAEEVARAKAEGRLPL